MYEYNKLRIYYTKNCIFSFIQGVHLIISKWSIATNNFHIIIADCFCEAWKICCHSKAIRDEKQRKCLQTAWENTILQLKENMHLEKLLLDTIDAKMKMTLENNTLVDMYMFHNIIIYLHM